MPTPLDDPGVEEDLRFAVERGCALFDMAVPGWNTEVNTETLDIATSGMCVYGQLLESKLDGLPLCDDMDTHLGFYVSDEVEASGVEHHEAMERLTELWVAAIEERNHGLVEV